MGDVEGKIEASEKCEIRIGSHVRAEIYTPSIYIEEGAVFEGTSHMIGSNGELETRLEAAAEPDLENAPS
jgi:cytoskeletal protein CcmA (bactofilin family)